MQSKQGADLSYREFLSDDILLSYLYNGERYYNSLVEIFELLIEICWL